MSYSGEKTKGKWRHNEAEWSSDKARTNPLEQSEPIVQLSKEQPSWQCLDQQNQVVKFKTDGGK